MKRIFSAIGLLVSVTASATAKWDSVAVFHRPEKVAIQINEPGANGRLQTWMTALGAGNRIVLQSHDKSFMMDCMRNEFAVNCALRLFPSANIEIGERDVRARFALADVGIDPAAAFYEIGFLNSNGDHVEIETGKGEFTLNAGKRR